MAKTVRYWYIKLAIVVGAAVWGAQPMHAGVATPSQTYYEQMNTHAFQGRANRLLEPAQAVQVVVAVPMSGQTSGASYSAARLQTGSSARVQSYGECAGYSYGGGDSHAAYNSISISSGNISQYSLPTIGVRSTLRGKAYASADEAYDAATSDKRILKAPPSGPITGGDGDNKPGMEVPIGDAPWILLLSLVAGYTLARHLRIRAKE